MASALYPGIAAALADAISVCDQTFKWNGVDYGCVVNVDSATLITSSALFPENKRPRPGETINVLGRDVQVLSIESAGAELAPGGYVRPGSPYIQDDPNNPSFSIHYGAFIKG